MAAFKSKDENHDSYEDFNSDKSLVRGGTTKKVGVKSAKTTPCANTKKETAEYRCVLFTIIVPHGFL